MKERVLFQRFLFVLIMFVGSLLLFYTLMTTLFQRVFFADFTSASCISGALILLLIYIVTKFNNTFDNQISNFLYFKDTEHYRVLLREAITDGLTELYDHKYFMLRLDEEIERARRYMRPLALLMIDIDHFKEYNDDFGHPAGDKVLAQLGDLFRRHSRKNDTIARYGGEEFALILPETKRDAARLIADRLRKYVEMMRFDENRNITISIGIGFLDAHDKARTKEDFIKTADEALYRAKASGRNRVEA
jgi:diguanylate cyclase (GGDEF)-like protein